MYTPCNNAAYLAKLCAGAEAIQEAKDESYLLATSVIAAFLVGGTLLFLHWQNQQTASAPLRKDRNTA